MILGIDANSRTVDLVALDEDTDTATWFRYQLAGHDAFDRARAIRDAMPTRNHWRDAGAVCAAIEEPRGIGVNTLAGLMRVQGVVLACLPADLLVLPLRPSSWRKAVGLPGNATKDNVYAFARERWNNAPAGMSQDAADAFCIALAARSAYERREAA